MREVEFVSIFFLMEGLSKKEKERERMHGHGNSVVIVWGRERRWKGHREAKW